VIIIIIEVFTEINQIKNEDKGKEMRIRTVENRTEYRQN